MPCGLKLTIARSLAVNNRVIKLRKACEVGNYTQMAGQRKNGEITVKREHILAIHVLQQD